MCMILYGNSSDTYGASPAVWYYTCLLTQVNVLCLNHSQAGWYLIYLPRKDERLS